MCWRNTYFHLTIKHGTLFLQSYSIVTVFLITNLNALFHIVSEKSLVKPVTSWKLECRTSYFAFHGNESDYFHNNCTVTNFKCGLGLERDPPSLVRTIGQLLDGEVADLIKKVDIIRLAERNDIHIIPSYCHLPVSCRSLVDRCGSPRSWKPQI